jgi:hypothetical protein
LPDLQHVFCAQAVHSVLHCVVMAAMLRAIAHNCSLSWASRSSDESMLHRISWNITAIDVRSVHFSANGFAVPTLPMQSESHLVFEIARTRGSLPTVDGEFALCVRGIWDVGGARTIGAAMGCP